MSNNERGTGRTQRKIEEGLVYLLQHYRHSVVHVSGSAPLAKDAQRYAEEWLTRHGIQFRCAADRVIFNSGEVRFVSMDMLPIRGQSFDLAKEDHYVRELRAERALVQEYRDDQETIRALMLKHGLREVARYGSNFAWMK